MTRGSGARGMALALALAVPAGCGSVGALGRSSTVTSPPAGPGRGSATSITLTIAAAASLTDALPIVGAAYARAAPAIRLQATFGPSSGLRAQIEQGAPIDVFLSADVAQPSALVAAGLADGPVARFAANEVVLVVPVAGPRAVAEPLDLARPGVRVVESTPGVPIAGYTQTAIEALGREPGYPADFAARVEANVVSREQDVRGVLAKVELGEADAAFVYTSDAASSSRIATIPLPSAARIRAEYGAVVVKRSADPAAAADFLRWLTGPDGHAAIRAAGLLAP